MAAKLPVSKQIKTVGQIKEGEYCYIRPSSMLVAKNGDCCIDETCVVISSKKSGQKLKITRVKDGFIAYIYSINYKWIKGTLEDYQIDDDLDLDYDPVYIPVVGFRAKSYQNLSEKEINGLMEQVVKEEDFEEAAKLRDILEELQKKSKVSSNKIEQS